MAAVFYILTLSDIKLVGEQHIPEAKLNLLTVSPNLYALKQLHEHVIQKCSLNLSYTH